jgi:four helix bundle protein
MREWIDELEDRTKAFGVRTIKLAERLLATCVPRSVVWQLIDSATSVAANHRACRRARSTSELVSKLSVVQEEADESVLWLETIQSVALEPATREEVAGLKREAMELRAIFATARATAKRRRDEPNQDDSP